jgi:hypothetical protein
MNAYGKHRTSSSELEYLSQPEGDDMPEFSPKDALDRIIVGAHELFITHTPPLTLLTSAVMAYADVTHEPDHMQALVREVKVRAAQRRTALLSQGVDPGPDPISGTPGDLVEPVGRFVVLVLL